VESTRGRGVAPRCSTWNIVPTLSDGKPLGATCAVQLSKAVPASLSPGALLAPRVVPRGTSDPSSVWLRFRDKNRGRCKERLRCSTWNVPLRSSSVARGAESQRMPCGLNARAVLQAGLRRSRLFHVEHQPPKENCRSLSRSNRLNYRALWSEADA